MKRVVSTQSYKRPSRHRDYPRRWAYVLQYEDGAIDYVSRYMYSTEGAAHAAGERDARGVEEYESENPL